MRTLKPFQLSLLFRTVDRGGEHYGCFSLFTMNSLSGAPLLRSEPSVWKTLAAHAPAFTEAGVLKSQPECMVFGHAYGRTTNTERGIEVQTEGVTGVRFGSVKKWFKVFGERVHPDALQALPLGKVPLDWSQTYGGPDLTTNPQGIGRAKDDAGAIRVPPLEHPDTPWATHGTPEKAADDAMKPVGFGPLDMMHPDRQRLAGTYDADYLRHGFPGLARDADWHFFQVAPLDQRLAAEPAPDEAFELIGMHPERYLLKGRLDATRPRVFVQRHDRPGIREVDCKLRTVVFLPDVDAVLQIWQGATKVGDEEASELSHVLGGVEWIARPKPLSHYADVMARRLDAEDGLLAALDDRDLLPEDLPYEALFPADFDLNRVPERDSLQDRMERKGLRTIEQARAEVEGYGLDADEHAPPLPPPRPVLPPVAQLGDYMRKLDAETTQRYEAVKAAAAKDIQTTADEFAARGESFDYVIKEMALTPVGPPKPFAPEIIDDLHRQKAWLTAHDTVIEEIDDMLADMPLQARWHDADRQRQAAYVASAHLQTPAPRTSGRFAERQKQWIAERLAAGETLAGFDLTGADLRGFDLAGAKLDGAMLEGACFDGVRLRNASARGAVLAHASFVGAQMDDTDLSDANLGRANLREASACRTDFSRAQLWETDFTQATLDGANFTGAEALDTRFAGADLSNSKLDELLLHKTDLTGTRFDHASMRGTQLLDTALDGASFRGTQAPKLVFYKARAEAIDFDGADLSGAMFIENIAMPRATMRRTRMAGLFAHGADFEGADLSEANLDDSQLARCSFKDGKLRGARARGANLRFAELSGVDATGADLQSTLMANATMKSTCLDSSNLHAADLSRIRIDDRTTFTKASTERLRLFPRWEPKP